MSEWSQIVECSAVAWRVGKLIGIKAEERKKRKPYAFGVRNVSKTAY